jgi:hypothetical protein
MAGLVVRDHPERGRELRVAAGAVAQHAHLLGGALKMRPCLSSSAPCRAILGARSRQESGTSAAILPFSHPPWASPLAAMEQNKRNASSLLKISP